MRDLPISDATQRFLVVGGPGSGKSTVLGFLMQSVLPYIIEPGFDHRALIYDAKRDTLPALAAMGFRTEATPEGPAEVRTLNPFDKRGFAWNLCRDIDSPAAALQLSTILIAPEEHSSQPFFTDSARLLLHGVLLALLHKRKQHSKESQGFKWSLRDVILIMQDVNRLRSVLLSCRHSKDRVALLLDEPKVAANIMSTVATKLLPFEIVAALWHHAEKEGRILSLNDWVNGKFILVLGSHPANRAAIQPINQGIFRRIADLLLTQPDVPHPKNKDEPSHGIHARKTWLFLDEVREAGKLDGLSSILNQGRSKGVCTVLGFQDIEGMRRVYGNEEAHEIIGQCDNKTVLRTESYPTAKWAEEHFGQALFLEYTASVSHTQAEHNSQSQSEQQTLRQAPIVLASKFMSIPRTGLKNPRTGYHNPLSGWHDIPSVGAYGYELSWPEVQSRRRQGIPGRPPIYDVLGEDPRSPDDQYLEFWDDDEIKQLGVSAAPPASATAVDQQDVQATLDAVTRHQLP